MEDVRLVVDCGELGPEKFAAEWEVWLDCVDHWLRIGTDCGTLAAVYCRIDAVGVGEPYETAESGVPDLDGGVKCPGVKAPTRFFLGLRNGWAFGVEGGGW